MWNEGNFPWTELEYIASKFNIFFDNFINAINIENKKYCLNLKFLLGFLTITLQKPDVRSKKKLLFSIVDYSCIFRIKTWVCSNAAMKEVGNMMNSRQNTWLNSVDHYQHCISWCCRIRVHHLNCLWVISIRYVYIIIYSGEKRVWD